MVFIEFPLYRDHECNIIILGAATAAPFFFYLCIFFNEYKRTASNALILAFETVTLDQVLQAKCQL